ncbi:MAG: SIR2 family protein [Prolixibacteraceae bacterium]|nr:SIR2 family protein [Prolixibacteraceae bacterium]MBN2775330.1 SIR2 family protein [Prolixibacteraceae bacterium]
MPNINPEIKKICRENFKKRNITLYLGAGVSVDNNLPSWEKLVLAMYFSTISKQKLGGMRPYSNYLYAIAEWYLKYSSEPLEITARKLQKYYDTENDDNEFIELLHTTLYGSMLEHENIPYGFIDGGFIRLQNHTLDIITKLCELPQKGVDSVITYNYDNLLEIALQELPCKSIFKKEQVFKDELPVFHVHGFIPLDINAERSMGKDLVFTEDKYHEISNNPYNWSSLVQVQKMCNSVGIMIGLSLSDRNMRRLLDAVRNSPVHNRNFALLQIPDKNPPEEKIINEIHERAKELLYKFKGSGIKSEQDEHGSIFTKSELAGVKSNRMGVKGQPIYQIQISDIIKEVKILEQGQQEFVLKQLGIEPIWFEEFNQIPQILRELFID